MLTLLVVALAAAPATPPKTDAQGLRAALDGAIAKHDLPSGATAVVAGGKIVFQQAWGPRRDDLADPVDVDALFRIGSITKTFTALAVLQLRDAGKLSLDDPLTKWIPEAKLQPADPGDRAPTVGDVLGHRSGLPRVGRLFYAQDDHDLTQAELIRALDVQLQFAPGTKFLYSNLGFAALGLVIQRASGQRYRDYVTKMLLRPLGMATACWDGEDVPPEHRVFGHVRRFFGKWGRWEQGGTRWRLGATEAAGGLYASAPELARLALFELGDIEGPVSRASVLESQAPGQPCGPRALGAGYGLSLMKVNGVGPALFKNGGLANWSSAMLLDPSRDLGVVLLVAGETDGTDVAAADLLRAAVKLTPATAPQASPATPSRPSASPTP